MPPSRRPRRPSPTVSIVIPVRDAAGLPPMLRGLPAADEVIVVTAGPGPDAAVLAACPDALLVRQTRTGLGNALACGFAVSTGDVVVTLDGDGATDPGELPRYVEALRAGADAAFGSRYRAGGRDLTAGRFRRGLNLALAWLLNILYGVRRTDPGFGYTAWWRDALDDLALPDPAASAPAEWGDGPEIEALLAVRAAARGLTVTEVPGVAYPRLRRSSRADRTTVRHWLRALATEFPHRRSARPPRHAAADRAAGPGSPPPHPGFAPSRRSFDQSPTAEHSPPPPRGGRERRALPDRRIPLSDRRSETAPGSATGPDSATGPGSGAGPGSAGPGSATGPGDSDRVGMDPVAPIWGPPRRHPEPADLWLADIPAPLDRPARPRPPITGPPAAGPPAIASVPAPGRRAGDAERREVDGRGDEAPAEPPREVGARRRHLERYRQRPDLRVINGEGGGSEHSRSGRLRAVPPRETTGGRPGPPPQ
jgi:hypothetical protein